MASSAMLRRVALVKTDLFTVYKPRRTVSPPLWSSSQEFMAANPEVPGSISSATGFAE
jgi:hypothetical protein